MQILPVAQNLEEHTAISLFYTMSAAKRELANKLAEEKSKSLTSFTKPIDYSLKRSSAEEKSEAPRSKDAENKVGQKLDLVF